MMAQPESAAAYAEWPELVRRVRDGEASALEDLYEVFSRSIRFYLWRQIGPQDLTDRLHDIFLIVAESIRSGELREPERLMGYVRTVARRQVAGHIHTRSEQRQRWRQLEFAPVLPDLRPSPENRVIRRQHREIAWRVLGGMRQREREVLVRFYFDEQPAEEICREMQLSETQFRLLKSRAKARLTQLCRSRMGSAS